VTRIVAGAAKGRVLQVPRGSATRPTSDRVREALFSRLEHEGAVDEARVLDLFAGSGALGLEAASRGARHVLLVDSAPAAAAVCRRNTATLGLPGVEVRPGTVASLLAGSPDEPYDLVLLDPPYDLTEDALALTLERLDAGGWLADRAVVVVERSSRSPEPRWPDGLTRFDDRRYGETRLWLAEPRRGRREPP
jgi:16S rRNA (guanine966-N2)-methyltransferase